MFNNLIGKNKELGRFLFCERYTLPPVKNSMYIAEGQELKRGAVVDVNGVLVGTNSLMPYAVLEFDCDTRSGGKEASVFVKGEFNFDKLYFADGLDQSDLDNIVYNGSGLGIVIKPYEYAEGFSPLMVQQSSNIAPNYTNKTYEANSYVMHDGVLYTNPNVIGTAEDWNPAHWTQTAVAEMMAGAQKKYVSVTKTAEYDSDNKRYMLDVNQKEVITVEIVPSAVTQYASKLYLNLGTTDDALIILKKQGTYANRLSGIAYSRQMSDIFQDFIHGVTHTNMDYYLSERIMLSDEWEEGHGGDYPVIPTDLGNTEILAAYPDNTIVTEVDNVGVSLGDDLTWIIRVIGDTVLIATNQGYLPS